MDVRRRPSKPVAATDSRNPKSKHPPSPLKYYVDEDPSLKVPSSLYFVNAPVIFVFFTGLYYLLSRWREKIRSPSPLHVLSTPELTALLAFTASSVYLLGFFGVEFFQSLLLHPPPPPPTSGPTTARKRGWSPPLPRSARGKPPVVDPVKPAAPKAKPVETERWDEPISLTGEDEEVIAAAVRREALQRTTGKSLIGLPLEGFDCELILGQCCEMPVGYVQIPVGIAGPLVLDGREYSVPMATTEGCLVASTNRSCKVIAMYGGASSVVFGDGMTRAPVVRFGSAKRAAELKFCLESPANFAALSSVFNSSGRFARLQSIKCAIAGKNLYLRFSCSTGDAMGMNMVSKGVQNVMDFLQSDYPDMDVIGISGNFCSDKMLKFVYKTNKRLPFPIPRRMGRRV